eukprot:CAMPEP_0197022066 /NCGR_PEP_ID=MMETSP1384-20130603/2973_1 /TAXON_ID=29189 /ORGANISM="Ammonia sp." /LENGTH=296 /DNA_ID=CAMNT_0042450031 /DNA_START=88 /DNA_END=975 /DNA_ORIENTATION=+
MAAEANNQQMQPGDANEGKYDDETGSTPVGNEKYGEYEFEFTGSGDSLFVAVKSKKSKRLFNGKFSKQELSAMKLTQSVPEIINIIKMARAGGCNGGQSLKCEFKIAFSAEEGSASVEEMAESFSRGDAMYIVVSIREPFWNCDYVFKLEEQQRDEIDIQADIIEDLRAELAELKQKLQRGKPRNPMAVLKCSTVANPVPWNVVHIASDLQGMVRTEDSNASLVIGVAGRYKISARFGLNNDWGSTLTHDLQLNGTTIAHARTYQSHCNTFDEVRALNEGDKLCYKLNSTVSNDYW